MNSPALRIASLMIAAVFTARQLLAQGPFTFKVADDGHLRTESRSSALHWSPGGDALRAGTLNGRALNWHLPGVAFAAEWKPLDDFTADGLATLVQAGDAHQMLYAGFAKRPKIVLLPGAEGGDVALPDGVIAVTAVISQPSRPRFAALTSEGVVVFNRGSKGELISPHGRYALLAWSEPAVPPTPNANSRLVAHEPANGQLLLWDAETLAAPDSIPLPFLPPPTDGDEWKPLELTAMAAPLKTGMIVAGDAQGRVRTWTANRPAPDKRPANKVDLSVFSDDGKVLIDAKEDALTLRQPNDPNQPAPLTSKAEDVEQALVMRFLQFDDKRFAAVAWQANSGHPVTLHKFPSPDGQPMFANPVPTHPLRALAIRPNAADDQVAAIERGVGVIFLEAAVPTDPPSEPADPFKIDTAVGALEYSQEGALLAAVGKRINLYDPATHTLLDQSDELELNGMNAELTAAAIRFVPENAAPTSIIILLATSHGELELWKVTLSADGRAIDTVERQAAAVAAADPIVSLVWRDNRALVGSRNQTDSTIRRTLWRINLSAEEKTNALIPLEMLNDAEPVTASALADGGLIVDRLAAETIQSQPWALQVVACGSSPLRHLAAYESKFVIASNAAGVLYVAAGEMCLQTLPTSKAISALAVDASGTTLVAGIEPSAAEPVLMSWNTTVPPPDGTNPLSAPQSFHLSGSAVSSLRFHPRKPDFLAGFADGRLLRFHLNSERIGATTLRLDDATVDGNFGVVDLDWQPPFEPDPQRILVIDGRGRMSVRTLTRLEGPSLSLGRDDRLRVPSPWYSASVDAGSRQLAVVGRGGDVGELDWPPRRKWTDGWEIEFFDETPILKLSSPYEAASKEPLYGVAWLRGAGDAHPILAVGGVGTKNSNTRLFLRNGGSWKKIASNVTGQPMVALSADSDLKLLAAGWGTPESSPAIPIWLSVWRNGVVTNGDQAWDGHSGPIRTLSFASNRLASLDTAGNLIVWDCRNLGATIPPSTRYVPTPTPTVLAVSLAWLTPKFPNHLAVLYADGRVVILHVAWTN